MVLQNYLCSFFTNSEKWEILLCLGMIKKRLFQEMITFDMTGTLLAFEF